jgi:Fic family protein
MIYNPPFELTEKMFDLVAKIMENLGFLKSANDLEKLPRLRKTSRIKSVHSSLAIENNPLTLKDVGDVKDGKQVLGKNDDILAVKNAFQAYKLISKQDPYKLSDLLTIHGIMMKGLDKEAGSLRSKGVGVFDSNGKILHMAPPANMVYEDMSNLFAWLKESKTNILIKSCVFHYEFEFIHPFNDGNGRMGRLWQTVILSKWKPIFEWIPIETIIKENQKSYYKAIEDSSKVASSTPFIEFMLECINSAIINILNSSRKSFNHISTQINLLMNVIEEYPLSANELMKKLNLKSRNSFRQHYLDPALDAGLIAMTNPDKPKSKNQKYYKLI